MTLSLYLIRLILDDMENEFIRHKEFTCVLFYDGDKLIKDSIAEPNTKSFKKLNGRCVVFHTLTL